MKKNQKLLASIVIIAIVVIAGYFVVSKKSNNPNNAEPTSQIDTSNGTTYKNDKYGFEFSYPKDWVVVGCATPNPAYPDLVVYLNPDVVSPCTSKTIKLLGLIEVYQNDSTTSGVKDVYNKLLQTRESNKSQSNYKEINIKIDTIDAKEFVWDSSTGSTHKDVIFIYKNNTYRLLTDNSDHVSLYKDEKSLAENDAKKISEFDQILSTFKFTEPTAQTDTSNWKQEVLNQFQNLTDWSVDDNIPDWRPVLFDPNLFNKYPPGVKIVLTKIFNENGFNSPGDNEIAGSAQKSLENTVKMTLSKNNWKLIASPTEGSFYNYYLYEKDGKPLLLGIGSRDAVTGGMFILIQFQY